MGKDLFTEGDLNEAVDDMATLPYFPAYSRASVMRELAKMCPSKSALRWLTQQAKMLDQWPGLGELRGLLCTKFDAADGIDRYCTLPGFTAADGEAKFIEGHEQRKIAGAQSSPTFKQLMGEVKR